MSTVRNIIQAGNQSANASVKAYKGIRDNSVKYDEIAKEGIKGRANEKIAAMEADAQVAKSGLNAAQAIKREKIDRDLKAEVRGIYRPAKIAKGFAGVVGAASLMVANKKDKSRTAIIDAARQKEIDRLTALRNEPYEGEKTDTSTLDFLNEQLEKLNGSRPTRPGTSTPSSSGGDNISGNLDGYSKNWQALQTVIRNVEGTSGDKGYTTRFGGAQFTDLSQHPNIAAPTPWGTQSEAAGAFQFMKPTWDEASSALGLSDFSPQSQQKAGRFLTDRRGVNPDADLTDFNNFSAAISKLSPEWAGLPNSGNGRSGYHGQANASMTELHKLYLQTLNGG